MPSALVVIGSPNPRSFCHAMATRAADALERNGVECDIHDLYVEGFQPVAPLDEASTVGMDVEAAVAACADAVVLATDVSAIKAIVAASPTLDDASWLASIDTLRVTNARRSLGRHLAALRRRLPRGRGRPSGRGESSRRIDRGGA